MIYVIFNILMRYSAMSSGSCTLKPETEGGRWCWQFMFEVICAWTGIDTPGLSLMLRYHRNSSSFNI